MPNQMLNFLDSFSLNNGSTIGNSGSAYLFNSNPNLSIPDLNNNNKSLKSANKNLDQGLIEFYFAYCQYFSNQLLN